MDNKIPLLSEEDLSIESRKNLRIDAAIEQGIIESHHYVRDVEGRIIYFKLYWKGFNNAINICQLLGCNPSSEKISYINELISKDNISDFDKWNELLRLSRLSESSEGHLFNLPREDEFL